jgi:hypothetical protein
LKSAYQHLEDSRAMLYAIFQGKDSLLIMRRIREWNAQEIESNLRDAFADEDRKIPLDVLTSYLAGAQTSLLHWWLEKRQSHALANLAQTFHRWQSAVILGVFGMQVIEKILGAIIRYAPLEIICFLPPVIDSFKTDLSVMHTRLPAP